MMRWISKYFFFILATLFCGCEHPYIGEGSESGSNVVLQFSSGQSRAGISEYFSKLNVMLFDQGGQKVFDKLKTQYATDADFGKMELSLLSGIYTVVAIGHSSKVSATIKSPQMVQFTASDGEKLTDTFCVSEQISVGDDSEQYDLVMQRVSAMFRMVLTDETIPPSFTRMLFEYSGGSANFNPSTSEGCTKSTQTENRIRNNDNTYEVFTFPYLKESGVLKITASALDNSGTTIRQQVFEQVPVTRNRITIYTGQFFDGTEGNITQSDLTFSVDGEWDGEDEYDF